MSNRQIKQERNKATKSTKITEGKIQSWIKASNQMVKNLLQKQQQATSE